jgi:OmpA-OmpF porin, OOP family
MALFDSIISEASERFGLGNKAGGLLASLLSLMTDQNQGGFNGFLNLFKNAGLSDMVSGWISSGDSDELSHEQVTSVLGKDTINKIADQHDISTEETTSALGYMIPAVVDRLTPDGTVPAEKDLLSKIGDFLSGIGGAVTGAALGAAGAVGVVASGAVDKVGDAAGATIDAGKAVVGGAADMVGDAAGATLDAGKKVVGAVGDTVGDAAGATVDAGKKVVGAVGNTVGGAFNRVGDAVGDVTDGGGSMLKWLIPLILLLLLLALGYMFCSKPSAPTTVGNTNSNANKGNTNANATAKAVDSSFKLVAKDGKYVATGVIADQKTLDDLKAKLTAQFGEGNVDFSGLKLDATAKPFGTGWWDGFTKLLPNLKDWKTGTLAFVGSAITEAVGLPKAALDGLKSLFTGWKLPISVIGEGDAIKQANEEAKKELETATSLEEVIKALNVSIINFPNGQSGLPADAKPLLEKAAEVLKKQPDGTVVKISGYTDTTGNADRNKKLAQQRADSVKKALTDLGVKPAMLFAEGVGNTDKFGDNATDEGRFQNRRIEYTKSDGTAPSATTTETKVTNTNAKPATANTNAANK